MDPRPKTERLKLSARFYLSPMSDAETELAECELCPNRGGNYDLDFFTVWVNYQILGRGVRDPGLGVCEECAEMISRAYAMEKETKDDLGVGR